MIKFHASCIHIALLILLSSASATAVAVADEALAADFENGLNQIITAVRTPSGDHQVLAQHIDFAAITWGVLGKHRKTLSDEQRERFQQAFEVSMFSLLDTATKAAGEFEVRVTQTKISEKRPDTGQAYADIIPAKGKNIAIIASVAQQESGWKVRNLIFDGVNLGRTYRSQFDQLMQEHDGNADLAIDAWEASTQSKAP